MPRSPTLPLSLVATLLALSACGSGSDGSAGANCDYSATIDSISCRFWDNPDVFASDSWFIDLNGTAGGPYQTEMTVNCDAQINTTAQCASWPNYAAFSCVSQSGNPTSTTWSGEVEVLTGTSESSRSITVTIKARGVGQTTCTNTASVSKTVTCTK